MLRTVTGQLKKDALYVDTLQESFLVSFIFQLGYIYNFFTIFITMSGFVQSLESLENAIFIMFSGLGIGLNSSILLEKGLICHRSCD